MAVPRKGTPFTDDENHLSILNQLGTRKSKRFTFCMLIFPQSIGIGFGKTEII